MAVPILNGGVGGWEKGPSASGNIAREPIQSKQVVDRSSIPARMEGSPMPILDYVRQTAQSVSVTYADMPAGVAIVFHNETSGADTSAQNGALAAGSGSADIAIPKLPGGQYRLRARHGGQYVAETVKFYIN
jgi:hypothetical protein